jgi:hypothetical protein
LKSDGVCILGELLAVVRLSIIERGRGGHFRLGCVRADEDVRVELQVQEGQRIVGPVSRGPDVFTTVRLLFNLQSARLGGRRLEPKHKHNDVTVTQRKKTMATCSVTNIVRTPDFHMPFLSPGTDIK